MTHVLILVPSYKRPEVLDLTLKNLSVNTVDNDFKVSIVVGLLKADDGVRSVACSYEGVFADKSIYYNYISYDKNIGKAACLNNLYDQFKSNNEYIVTIDNDMVISKPWLHLIKESEVVDYDVMGFGSSLFWAHDPRREDCTIIYTKVPYTIYNSTSVAGGMMLIPRKFMSGYRWTNHGGVYGRDDQHICLTTQRKYVLMWPIAWLEHDPLSDHTAKLKAYNDKKKDLYDRGINVFPEGWDE